MTEEKTETVSREAYDKIVTEFTKYRSAFFKAISVIANRHAEDLIKNILEEVEKESSANAKSK